MQGAFSRNRELSLMDSIRSITSTAKLFEPLYLFSICVRRHVLWLSASLWLEAACTYNVVALKILKIFVVVLVTRGKGIFVTGVKCGMV